MNVTGSRAQQLLAATQPRAGKVAQGVLSMLATLAQPRYGQPQLLSASPSPALDTIPGCAWSATPDGRLESINGEWRDYLGLHAEAALSDVWLSALHPHDKRHFLDFWATLASAREPAEVEARLRRHDGLFRWFVVRVVPQRDATGRVQRWYGQNTDVEDRKHAEITLAGEKSLLEMVAAGHALSMILEALCSLVSDIAGSCVCSVLLADTRNHVVRHAAGRSLPSALAQALDGRPFGQPHWGPCARALEHNAQVIVDDVAQHPSWQAGEWSRLCLTGGLRACWTTPIRSSAGQPLGAFAVYQRTPGGPSAMQLSLIERFTHVASIAVERAHNESALERTTAQLARARRLSSTGTFSYRADTHHLVLSDDIHHMCGFDPHAVIAPEAMRDLVHPDDLSLFRALLGTGDLQSELECRLRLHSGEIRHVHLVADMLRDDTGKLIEYVGVVRDVTERKARTERTRKQSAELDVLRARYATLTTREREVMTWVVAGLLNKEIAERLGTSEVTVKAHRGKMMQKMNTDRLPDLVRIATKLGLPLPERA